MFRSSPLRSIPGGRWSGVENHDTEPEPPLYETAPPRKLPPWTLAPSVTAGNHRAGFSAVFGRNYTRYFPTATDETVRGRESLRPKTRLVSIHGVSA